MKAMVQERVAIVTGGGRGIGRCTVEALLAQGCRVAVVDNGCSVDGSNPDAAIVQQVAEDLYPLGPVTAHAVDASDFDEVGALVQDVQLEYGRLDIVVACAGTLRVKPFWRTTEDDWGQVMASHVGHTFAVCRHVARYWAERGPHEPSRRIVTMTAATGMVGRPDMGTSHAAAKGAIAAMTVSLAHELFPLGATINAVAAANVRGRMADHVRASIPASTNGVDPGDPRHCAHLIGYLCSPDSGWITGQVFRVVGGTVGWYGPRTIQATIDRKGHYWSLDELRLGMRELMGVYPDVNAFGSRYRHEPDPSINLPRRYSVLDPE